MSACGKVQVRFRHPQVRADAVEAEFAIRAGEGQRISDRRFAAVDEPFVHAPKMCVTQIKLQFVDEARNQRQLLRRPDRAADPGRCSGVDCFQALMYSSASAR